MRQFSIPAILILTALPACKVGIAPQIFTSDVMSALDAGSAINAQAVLDIESGSEDKCKEHSAAIGEALKKGFAEATFLECTRVDITSVARYRVTVPMGAKNGTGSSALGIEVTDVGAKVAATMRRSPAAIDQIVAALPDELKTFADQSYDPSISVTLQNDLAGDAEITMMGAFIDGQPYQVDNTFTVARRAELKITLSDVGNAALMAKDASNASILFFMAKPK